jgi:hypothetical protein
MTGQKRQSQCRSGGPSDAAGIAQIVRGRWEAGWWESNSGSSASETNREAGVGSSLSTTTSVSGWVRFAILVLVIILLR